MKRGSRATSSPTEGRPPASPARLQLRRSHAGTLSQRATFFEAKIKAAIEHGVAGYLIWVKSPYYDPTDDIYAIGDNDPTDGAAGRYCPAPRRLRPPACVTAAWSSVGPPSPTPASARSRATR